jgi:hypothetical protein
MTIRLKFLLAVVASGSVAAAPASAGLIPWSYSSTGGSAVVHFGDQDITYSVMGVGPTYVEGPNQIIPYGPAAIDPAPAGSWPDLVPIVLTITDGASGGTHEIPLRVSFLEGDYAYFRGGEGQVIDSFRLGGSRYSVALNDEPLPTRLEVHVEAAAQSPEPATLTLACLGLLGTAARWYRGRMSRGPQRGR